MSPFTRLGSPVSGPRPIEVLCWPRRRLSLVHVDRCLFSLAYQAYRALCITIVADRESVGEIDQLVDKFDWSGFSRRPAVLAFPDDARDDTRLDFALRRVEQRFVAVLDMEGTLYTRGYQLLMNEACRSRAALVYGDAVTKHVRMYDGFLYEVTRTYRRAADTATSELRSTTPLPLGACLLDRDRIASADLRPSPTAGQDSDDALVLRLLSRYPSRPVAERVPVFARHAESPARDEPGLWDGAYRVSGADTLRRSVREVRRRLIPR